MTDKEFKRLGRAQLLDIIYQLQLQVDDLSHKNQELENALREKRLRVENAGDLARAALEINECFKSAQNAADQYLEEIRIMREEAETECQRLIAKAREEADSLLSDAKKQVDTVNRQVPSIMKTGSFNDAEE